MLTIYNNIGIVIRKESVYRYKTALKLSRKKIGKLLTLETPEWCSWHKECQGQKMKIKRLTSPSRQQRFRLPPDSTAENTFQIQFQFEFNSI